MSARRRTATLEGMTNNNDPAVAAARLGDELKSIAGRMSAVSADFEAFTASLARESETPQDADAPPVAATGPQPAPQPEPEPQPQPEPQPHLQYATVPPTVGTPFTRQPFGPQSYGVPSYAPQPYPPPPYGPPSYAPRPFPAPPATPAPSLGKRLSDAAERGLVGRVLAAVGVAITLIGIVLLLVLAAQAGLLRPELRVAGGAVFAAALVGVGSRVGRRPEKRPGAVALIATGVAAALLDVLAATAIYGWLPESAALVAGALIGGGGLWSAHRWDSQALALMVSVPLLVFAPVVAGGVDELLVCFMLTYAAATLWLQAGRDWTPLFVVNTVATTLPMTVFVVIGDGPAWFLAVTALTGLALALCSAIMLAPASSRAVVLGLTSVAAAIPLPMIAGQWTAGAGSSTAVIGLGAVLFVVAAVATRGPASVPFVCRVVWLAAGAVLISMALGVALDASTISLGFLAGAVIMGLAARWADDLRGAVRIAATVFAGLGLSSLLETGGAQQLLYPGGLSDSVHATLLVGSLLGLAATMVLAREWGTAAPSRAQQIWLIGGLIGLWLTTELCVGVAGVATGGSTTGFRAGHLAATLVWFGSAAAALMWARRLQGASRTLTLATGLSVIAAAVAKLFLFDLAALDGMFRVIAFIVAGMVLLSLGVAYAQRFTSEEPAH